MAWDILRATVVEVRKLVSQYLKGIFRVFDNQGTAASVTLYLNFKRYDLVSPIGPPMSLAVFLLKGIILAGH